MNYHDNDFILQGKIVKLRFCWLPCLHLQYLRLELLFMNLKKSIDTPCLVNLITKMCPFLYILVTTIFYEIKI